MTTESTPGALGSSEGLGPASEAKRLVAHYQQRTHWFGGDEVDEVCRLIDAAVAAERERCAKLCESLGSMEALDGEEVENAAMVRVADRMADLCSAAIRGA